MKLAVAAMAGTIAFTSCNNDNNKTTTETTDTTTMQPSGTMHDTMSNANMNMNMDTGLMATMRPMMDSMKMMNMTGDFDIDFANTMIRHHQGAIDMSQKEVAQGKDEKMKSMAQKIISEQQKEQQKLRDFVASYKPSGMKHAEGELQKSMSTAMDQMKTLPMTGDMDKDFATMMMHHHQHGIDMAKMEVANGMSDKLKKMAQKSIDEQTEENREFQDWLNSHK